MNMWSRMYTKREYTYRLWLCRLGWTRCHERCEERYKIYTYSRLYTKIEYLPSVVVQVVMDKVS